YGLRIDALVDERRDPIKSTEAASAYLKDLHEMFGDWELSLAAYNSGEYRVARILAQQKDVEDFWDMRDGGYLPSETSAYVPKFLAAVQIARAPEDYGFETPTHTPEHYEMVDVDRTVSLRAAADMCGVTATELAELNPALRSGVTPSGYSLRVPAGKAEPLRIGLATYVEPVHPRRNVARSTRGGGRSGRSIARGGRSTTAVAQGKKTSERLARTAPTIHNRRGNVTVQAARTRSRPVREAKATTTNNRRAPTTQKTASKKTVTRTTTAKAKKPQAPVSRKPRRG
ncbi:MAG: lytic transglycosylase domain-containing protein, partial [Candidatus Binatia bacterium]